MNARSRPGRLVAAAGLALLVASAALAQSPAQKSAAKPAPKPAATARGPWAMTVPLPTACYSNQDLFATKSEAALAAVNADRARQEALNAKIEERFRSIDPMELSQLMTQKMMEDPQNAMKYMEMMGATQDPATLQAQAQEEYEKEPRMQAEAKALPERYRAALRKANAPVRALYDALSKKLIGVVGEGSGMGVDEIAWPDWAREELDLIRQEANKAYVATCAQWFGAQGQMHAFMQRYKDYLVKERVPFAEKQDAVRAAQYTMANTPAESYRSLATHDAAADYIGLAGNLFRERKDMTYCTRAAPRGNCRDLLNFNALL